MKIDLGALLIAGTNCLTSKGSNINLQHEENLYPNTPDWEYKCHQKSGYVCGLIQK